MSETVCIHGTPVDPWYIHCDQCQHQADIDALLASTREVEQIEEELLEEDGS